MTIGDRSIGRCFNPRPRTGGDHAAADRLPTREAGFNPRPRTGGDVITDMVPIVPSRFQSTPPHGGRPTIAGSDRHACASFNPRPRTGGDPSSGRCSGDGIEFQSTPPHGGRRVLRPTTSPCWCFNPRPRTGGDLTQRSVSLARAVSIHAPARGATPLPSSASEETTSGAGSANRGSSASSFDGNRHHTIILSRIAKESSEDREPAGDAMRASGPR